MEDDDELTLLPHAARMLLSKYPVETVLRLTEQVRLFVDQAHSHILDWHVIAPSLKMSPSECQALWRYIAYVHNKEGRVQPSSLEYDDELDDGLSDLEASTASQDREITPSSKRAKAPSPAAALAEGRRYELECDSDIDIESMSPAEQSDNNDSGDGQTDETGKAKNKPTKKRQKHSVDKGNKKMDQETKPESEKERSQREKDIEKETGHLSTQPRPSADYEDKEKDKQTDKKQKPSKRPTKRPKTAKEPSSSTAQSGPTEGSGPQPTTGNSAAALANDKEQICTRKRVMWSCEEDQKLAQGVLRHGEGNWAIILRDQVAGSILLRRSSSQLAQRWNAIRRKVQKANFTGLDPITKSIAISLLTPPPPTTAAPAPQ